MTLIERAKKLGYPVYICPNNGETLLGMHDDDKVTCSCGKSNPDAPEAIRNVEQRTHVHVISYLKKA
jgi:hypothetical protein